MKVTALILSLLIGLPGLAEKERRFKIMLGENDTIAHQSFTVISASIVQLEGLAGSYLVEDGPDIRELLFTCWIIDSLTRKEMWNSMKGGSDYPAFSGPFPLKSQLKLPVGNYEIYIAKVMRRENAHKKLYHNTIQRPFITITGPDTIKAPVNGNDRITEMMESAVVSINKVGNSSSEVRTFRIKAETRLRLYALGEGKRRADTIYDYAWIEDITRNRKVWTMNPRTCGHAGGVRDNIKAQEVITLMPGKYAVHYESDDTHSFEGWLGLPPTDPYFWGISLWPDSPEDLVKIMIVREKRKKMPILSMIGIGNETHLIKGLEVTQPIGLRVQCIGEGTWQDGMVDYGWIEHAASGKTIWAMRINNTVHAGGADKNRMTNELIELKPGRYLIHYRTDKTHSFPDWNAPAPFKESAWGIQLYPLDQKEEPRVIVFTSEAQTDKPLAALLKPRGNAYLELGFKIEKTTPIRVECIGEGVGGRVYDRGWIENDDTGRIIWQMIYNKTSHAGGGEKNRVAQGHITLEPGNYKLLYETDDEHHYNDWNVDPPSEPEKYGIAVYKKQ